MSLLIPALLGHPTGGGSSGYTPKAYSMNNPAGTYLRLPYTGHTLSDPGTGFTFVAFFEVPSPDWVASETKYLLRGLSALMRFDAYTGTPTARPMYFTFIDVGYSTIWNGTTSTNFVPGQKYCLAMSFRTSDSRKQFYINGSPETLTGEGGSGGTPWLDLDWDLCASSGDVFGARLSHVWFHDESIDLSSGLGTFLTGTTTPVDNANGCKIYSKMDDLVTDDATAFTMDTPAGTPNNGNW